MNFGKFFYIFNLIIIFLCLGLYVICNNTYTLVIVATCLITVSVIEYKRIKKAEQIDYLSLRVVFIYIIGAAFSIFIFITSLLKK